MNWDSVSSYVFSTADIFSSDIVSGIYASSHELGSSILTLLKSLLTLAFYLSIVSCKVTIIVFPYLISAWHGIVEFHRTQLSIREIIGEILFFLLVFLYFIFRKRIIKTWDTLQSSIASRSKSAAKVAPHVLFLSSVLSFCILFHKFLEHVSTPSMMPFFTITVPLLNTLWLLYYSSSEKVMQSNYRQFLGIWIILGTYYALSTLLTFIPFLAAISGSKLQIIREVVVVVSICIQLSGSFTEIVLDFLAPVRRLMAHVPALTLGTSNRVVGILLYFLSPQHAHFLVSLFQDGVALLLASLFVFTPVPSVGVTIVCFLFPVAKTALSIVQVVQDDLLIVESTTPKKATSSNKASTPISSDDVNVDSKASAKSSSSGTSSLTSLALIAGAAVTGSGSWLVQPADKKESRRKAAALELQSVRRERRRWLEYWICVASLLLLDKFWVHVWPSIFMICALWMQHSYFQGSSKVIAFVHDFVMVLRVRNERLRRELEAKAATANLNADCPQETVIVESSSSSSSDGSATGSPVSTQGKKSGADSTISPRRASVSPGWRSSDIKEDQGSRDKSAVEDRESPSKVRKRVQKV